MLNACMDMKAKQVLRKLLLSKKNDEGEENFKFIEFVKIIKTNRE